MTSRIERVGNRYIFHCRACNFMVDESDRDFIQDVEKRHLNACPAFKHDDPSEADAF